MFFFVFNKSELYRSFSCTVKFQKQCPQVHAIPDCKRVSLVSYMDLYIYTLSINVLICVCAVMMNIELSLSLPLLIIIIIQKFKKKKRDIFKKLNVETQTPKHKFPSIPTTYTSINSPKFHRFYGFTGKTKNKKKDTIDKRV